MIQQRLPTSQGGDGRWYSPDRDLAYATPNLARAAMDQMATDRQDKTIRDYLYFNGVTDDDLGRAAMALANYIGKANDPDLGANPRQVLFRCGWFDCKAAARETVLMTLGRVFMCAYFTSIRDVTPKGEAPPLDADALYDSARRATYQFQDRRWVRWVSRQWIYLKGLFGCYQPPPISPLPINPAALVTEKS